MKKRLWVILRFAVAFVIILYLLSKISLSDVISSILTANLTYLLYAIVVNLLVWLIASYRLKFFSDLQGLNISTFQAFEINLSTVFYSLFLPGGNLAGGAIKFYKLSRKDNKMSGALVALALDRIFATIALCAVGLLFWVMSFPDNSGLFVLIMVSILTGLGGLCFLIFFDRDQRTIGKLLGFANWIYESPKLNYSVKNLSSLGKISFLSVALMIIISVISQLISVIIYYLILLSIDVNVPLVALGWIRSVVVLVTMIPISISGLGLRESSFIILLSAFGVNDNSAFAYSLIVFAIINIIPGMFGGLFEARKIFQAS
jgi:uncharacterized protein (TIRG00374 family)